MQSSTLATQTTIIKNARFMTTDALRYADELFHEGRLEDSRDILTPELERTSGTARLASAVMLGRTLWGMKDFTESLRVLTGHYTLCDHSQDAQLRAWFHGLLAATYHDIALHDERADYLDKARFEYVCASADSIAAGDADVAGCTENNIAFILLTLGRTDEAREHLMKARDFLKGHAVKLAEVDVTEAQVCLKEGNAERAKSLALSACALFDARGEVRLFDESLGTLRKALNDYAREQGMKSEPV